MKRSYNWRAVMGNSPSSSANPSGIQGICPNGWHVPSDVEWTTLTSYVSSQTAFQCGTTATYIAKSLSSQNYWYNYGNNGTCYVGDLSYPNNTTGFDARPAGYYSSGYGYDYSSNAYFWSSTQYSASNSYYRGLKYNAATVTSGNKAKYIGYSVRCVKGTGVLETCVDTIMEQTVSITYGTSYSWRGKTLTDGGVYYDSLQSNGGCDSQCR